MSTLTARMQESHLTPYHDNYIDCWDDANEYFKETGAVPSHDQLTWRIDSTYKKGRQPH
jgi:hypothetical protein